MTIAVAREEDLADLLRLMRGYCDFYGVAPSDEALLRMSRMLIRDPLREGVQLLARPDGAPRDGAGDGAAGPGVGFATVYWSWSTLRAGRIGVMNDLFVSPQARGTGLAEALIAACVQCCREHGAVWLAWKTARENQRAQRVYERVGAQRQEWIDYGLAVP